MNTIKYKAIIIDGKDMGEDFEYRVTPDGKVLSLKGGKLRELVPTKNKGGYLVINLCSKQLKGGRKQFQAHRLVAETFMLNPGELPVVHHRNGIKTDNRFENLEWVTHGTNSGEASFRGDIKAYLTAQQLFEIEQKFLLENIDINDLAAEYGVSARMIRDYLKGKTRSYCREKIHNGEFDDVVEPVDTVLTLEYRTSTEPVA